MWCGGGAAEPPRSAEPQATRDAKASAGGGGRRIRGTAPPKRRGPLRRCGQAAMRCTGIPSWRALSTRFSVMPLPGKAMTPLGRRLSSSSLHRMGLRQDAIPGVSSAAADLSARTCRHRSQEHRNAKRTLVTHTRDDGRSSWAVRWPSLSLLTRSSIAPASKALDFTLCRGRVSNPSMSVATRVQRRPASAASITKQVSSPGR